MSSRILGLALGLLMITGQVFAGLSALKRDRDDLLDKRIAKPEPFKWDMKKNPHGNAILNTHEARTVAYAHGWEVRKIRDGAVVHDKRESSSSPFLGGDKKTTHDKTIYDERAPDSTAADLGVLEAPFIRKGAHQLQSRAPVSTVAPDITDKSWINGVLSRIDLWREEFGAAPLVWSTTLASYALTQANKCLLKHSGGPYGENIYWVSPRSIDFYSQMKSGIDAWGNEYTLYNTSNPYNEAALHFTALVWKNAKSVGCAWTSTTCQNSMSGFYLFCEFNPVTNVIGQFEQNVQPVKLLVD